MLIFSVKLKHFLKPQFLFAYLCRVFKTLSYKTYFDSTSLQLVLLC